MRKKDLFAIEQLDLFSNGMERERRLIPRARYILLREIAQRLREMGGTDLRLHVESFLKANYRKEVVQVNVAIRLEGLKGLLELLFQFPIDEEKPEELAARLKAIEARLKSCPTYTLNDYVGVYLRMKAKKAQSRQRETASIDSGQHRRASTTKR